MDPVIALSRRYRDALRTAPTLAAALAAVAPGGPAVAPSLPPEIILPWFDDIRACDLGPGVDIIHVELGGPTGRFDLSAWRWADRIMLIDDGLIEPDSIRLIMSPSRPHRVESAAVDPVAWLVLCSFAPIATFEAADLRAKWGIDREFTALFGLDDAIFHGGFITPTGWRRPSRPVELPRH